MSKDIKKGLKLRKLRELNGHLCGGGGKNFLGFLRGGGCPYIFLCRKGCILHSSVK